jgi:pantetheine-phosphate adenylyltransferase
MKTALLCGSFDPIHDGHIEIIEKTLDLGHHVLVAVCGNPNKQSKYSLSLEQAGALARMNLECELTQEQLEKVNIITSGHSLVNIALDFGVDIILRGKRNKEEEEQEQRAFNDIKKLLPHNTDLLLMEAEGYEDLSSTKIRGQIREYIIPKYISPLTHAIMDRTINNRTVVGIVSNNKKEATALCQRICRGSPEYYDLDQQTWRLWNSNTFGVHKLRKLVEPRLNKIPTTIEELLEEIQGSTGKEEIMELLSPYLSQSWRRFSKNSRADIIFFEANSPIAAEYARNFVVVASQGKAGDIIAEHLNEQRKRCKYGKVIQFRTLSNHQDFGKNVGKLITTIRNQIEEDMKYEHHWRISSHEAALRGKLRQNVPR